MALDVLDEALAELRQPSPPVDYVPTSWTPIDLSAALSGASPPRPTVGTRTDGMPMLYPGRTHSFQGESESLKSWAAQLISAQEIARGNNVLYIDFEDDERGVVERLLALGCSTDGVRAHFVYLRPEEPLRNRFEEATPALTDFAAILNAQTFTLCIIDGVTEAMVTEGLDLIGNSDVATWMRRLPKFIAARGPAVAVIDHVTKSRETQGRYAIGGQHKLAGLTGAAYKFTLTRPLSRALGTEPTEGRSAITVEKDRPGFIRGRSVDQMKVGELVVTAYPDGGVTAAVVPPGSASSVDTALAMRILEYLALYEGSSLRRIEESVEGKGTLIRAALAWMAAPETGWLTVTPRGQSHLHFLTDRGREQLGDAGRAQAVSMSLDRVAYPRPIDAGDAGTRSVSPCPDAVGTRSGRGDAVTAQEDEQDQLSNKVARP